jgi:hypothetical protein
MDVMAWHLRGSLVSMLALSAALGCGPMGSEGKGPAPNQNVTAQAGASGGGSGGMSAGGAGGGASGAGNVTGGSGGGSGSEGVGGPLTLAGTPSINWDYTGIIGTGQSLSVGAQAGNVSAKATMPSENNLKLALGTATVPPFNADDAALSLTALVEPIRAIDNGYPSPYPRNLDGESPHTAMATQMTALAKAGGAADFVTVHTVVGESGQPMTVINKQATDNGTMGRAYAASMFEVQAIKRLVAAREGSPTYGVGAIFLTHGESDAGNANYENAMLQLWTDYNADIKAVTGQTQSIPLFTSQQHGIYLYMPGQAPSNINTSTTLQWKAGLDHPEEIVCVGPKYQYPYFPDYLHLVPLGYELMGEKYAEAFYSHVMLGRPWLPLYPLAETVTRSGPVITVDFHVPVPPLAWDDALPKPHITDLTEWAQGRGFEVRMGTTRLTIESVTFLDGDTVQITCTADVPAGATLGYAATNDGAAIAGNSPRIGNLRDSDPFVGAFTGMAQPNYSVAFEVNVP